MEIRLKILQYRNLDFTMQDRLDFEEMLDNTKSNTVLAIQENNLHTSYGQKKPPIYGVCFGC